MTAELLLVPPWRCLVMVHQWSRATRVHGNIRSGAARVPHTRWSTARRAGLCRPGSRLFRLRGGRILLRQQHFKTSTALRAVHFRESIPCWTALGTTMFDLAVEGDVHAARLRHPLLNYFLRY